MGGILGIALSLIPGLASLANGPLGSILETIAKGAAHKIFGTDDPETIKAQMAADQSKLEAYKAELAAQTEQLRIVAQDQADARAKQIEDLASARNQMMHLVDVHSPMAWAPVVVSTIIVAMFATTTLMLFFIVRDFTDRVYQLLLMGYGAEIPLVSQVANYWLGSSFSSAKKDETIQRQAQQVADSAPPSMVKNLTDTIKTAVNGVKTKLGRDENPGGGG